MVEAQVRGLRLGVSLNRSRRVSTPLNVELVTNGTFDTNTNGWTPVNSTLSIVSAAMRVTHTSGTAYAYQAVPTVAGEQYTVTGRAVAGTHSPYIHVGTTPNGFNYGFDGKAPPADFTPIVFTALGETTYISLTNSVQTAGWTGDFDNISMKRTA